MIVYGVCAGPSGKFDRIAGPTIERIREQHDELVVLKKQSSIFEAYNEVLRQARVHGDDLDAVVLIHDDVEVCDVDLPDKLRRLFSDVSIGVVGVIGASGVRSLEWWEYETHGLVREDRLGVIDFGAGTHDVDMVDGLFMALSPAAAHILTFDERYGGFHGYDGDLCASARAAGLRVVVADIDVAHRTAGGYGDKAAFAAADARFQQKWGVRPRGDRPGLRRRRWLRWTRLTASR